MTATDTSLTRLHQQCCAGERPIYDPRERKREWFIRYQSFLYQAAGWKAARRMVAKVEFHFWVRIRRLGTSDLDVAPRRMIYALSWSVAFAEWAMLTPRPSLGEEIVLVARK